MAITTHYILYLFENEKQKEKWSEDWILLVEMGRPAIVAPNRHTSGDQPACEKKMFKYKDDIPPTVPHSTRTI
jgi:hypothetical protein